MLSANGQFFSSSYAYFYSLSRHWENNNYLVLSIAGSKPATGRNRSPLRVIVGRGVSVLIKINCRKSNSGALRTWNASVMMW